MSLSNNDKNGSGEFIGWDKDLNTRQTQVDGGDGAGVVPLIKKLIHIVGLTIPRIICTANQDFLTKADFKQAREVLSVQSISLQYL